MDDLRRAAPRVFVTPLDLGACVARLEERERFSFNSKVTRPDIGSGGCVDRQGFELHLWGIGPIYGRTLVGRFLRLPDGTAIKASTRFHRLTVLITAFPVTGFLLILGIPGIAGGDLERGFVGRLEVFAVLATIAVAATIRLVALGSWRVAARDRVGWTLAELFGANEAADPAAVLAAGVVEPLRPRNELPRTEHLRRAAPAFGMGLFAYGVYIAAALSGDALADDWGTVGQYTPAVWFVSLGTCAILGGIAQLLPETHPWHSRLPRIGGALCVVTIASWFAVFPGLTLFSMNSTDELIPVCPARHRDNRS